MKDFSYSHPTKIIFGAGKISELGKLTKEYGCRCLLVTNPKKPALEPLYSKARTLLEAEGIAVGCFHGVIPNPTTHSVAEGAKAAKAFQADVLVPIGGGSSIDTAKAIAVEATHNGSAWDYLFFKGNPVKDPLPVVAITTTSGSGANLTCVGVISNPEEKCKSALADPSLYPRATIVDPELMTTLPAHITASTGFDAFCHAFESYISIHSSPYADVLALEAIRLIVKYMPRVLKNGDDQEAREAMALADTFAGLCISNVGVALPHGIGMTIGGYYPNVMHGEALAIVYPEFTRFTYNSAVERFASVARIFDRRAETDSDEDAAYKLCCFIDQFLKETGMWLNLKGFGVAEADVEKIARDTFVLPDYANNPRVPDEQEVLTMLKASYTR